VEQRLKQTEEVVIIGLPVERFGPLCLVVEAAKMRVTFVASRREFLFEVVIHAMCVGTWPNDQRSRRATDPRMAVWRTPGVGCRVWFGHEFIVNQKQTPRPSQGRIAQRTCQPNSRRR